jgi:tetratricopeptide (TPR) repeat protein
MNKPDRRHAPRAVKPPCSSIWILLVLLMLTSGYSCGRKSVLEKAAEEYEKGRYREAIFIVRHHFRRGGERQPELLLLVGKAWLRLGSEAEAEDAFAECFSRDSTLAPEISLYFKKEAEKNLQAGLTLKGKRFMRLALSYDRTIDFGVYDAMAGEILLDRKDYAGAVTYLERYFEEHADSAGAAEVMLSIGSAYEEIGKTEQAVEVYRRFLDRYTESRFRTTVTWKLENLLYRMAEELAAEERLEEAEGILGELAGTASARLVREKANFLLGEISEQKGDRTAALRYYREVVNLNLGSSGRLIEKAKERIEELELAKKRY